MSPRTVSLSNQGPPKSPVKVYRVPISGTTRGQAEEEMEHHSAQTGFISSNDVPLSLSLCLTWPLWRPHWLSVFLTSEERLHPVVTRSRPLTSGHWPSTGLMAAWIHLAKESPVCSALSPHELMSGVGSRKTNQCVSQGSSLGKPLLFSPESLRRNPLFLNWK